MSSDKVFLVSYKKNGEWNPVHKLSKKQYKKQGFKVTLVKGYNLKEHPEIKKNQVVYLNFLEHALVKAEIFLKKNKNHKGVFISEDDAYINISLKELKNIVDLKENGNLKWIGYQKKLKTKDTYYYVGTQLVWVPRNKIKKLIDKMYEKTAQHLNGFFSKNIDTIIDIVPIRGLVDEIEHTSITTGKIRKGLKLQL